MGAQAEAGESDDGLHAPTTEATPPNNTPTHPPPSLLALPPVGSAPPQGTADHRNSPFQGPWGADTPVHSGSSALRDCGSEKSRGSPAATDAKPCGSCSSVQLKSEPPANTIPFKDGDTVSEPGKGEQAMSLCYEEEGGSAEAVRACAPSDCIGMLS